LGALSENSRFPVHARKEQKKHGKIKKAREGINSPICKSHPPFAAATVICMWGRTVEVIERAKFQVNQFGGFGDTGAEIDPPPLTWRLPLTTVYALTCHTLKTNNVHVFAVLAMESLQRQRRDIQ